jgi:formylglycine-generating enzyme required for sulfatase activity
MAKQLPLREIHRRSLLVAQAGSNDQFDFKRLLARAGIDPQTDLRNENWSGVSFAGLDIKDYDLSGALLQGCNFSGASLVGTSGFARFDQAELGRVVHRLGRNPHLSAELTPLANLREAADWDEYVKLWRKSPTRQSDDHLAVGSIFQDAPYAPELVVVPAGAFIMGSPATEPEHQANETQVPVTIPKPFAVGRFAVTFDEWDAYTNDTGPIAHRPDDRWGQRGNFPLINVSWDDAFAYVEWLSEKTGKVYRLLSEAEWEYVARAGTDTPFWWGNTIAPELANYNAAADIYKGGGALGEYRKQTVPVDKFKANPWGLFNVHGNVFEWCADHWRESNAGNPGDGTARTAGSSRRRAVRGGSWYDVPQNLRSAYRYDLVKDVRYYVLGLRVARTL